MWALHASRLTRSSFLDKPIAGEIVVAVVGLKGVIGFGLSFGTNLWVDSQGYQNGEPPLPSVHILQKLIAHSPLAFGQMAGIAGVFLVGVFTVSAIWSVESSFDNL